MTGLTKRSPRYLLPLLLALLGISIGLRVLAEWVPIVSMLSWVALVLLVAGLLLLLWVSVRQLDLRKAGPILMKEMRSRMRGTRTPLLMLLAAGAAGITALFIIALGQFSGSEGMYYEFARMGQSLFMGVSSITAVIVALVTPAIASGVVAHEYETQTFEFLLITPLSEAGILGGKLLAALSFAAMLVLCTLPVTALAFIFGGVAPWLLFAVPFFTLTGAYCMGAISLYCSTRFRKVAVATTVAYVACVVLLAVQPLVISFQYELGEILVIITGCVVGLIVFALFILGILAGTSALIKREKDRRFLLIKRLLGILLPILVFSGLFLALFAIADSSYDSDIILYGNPGYSLSILLDYDSSLDEDWPMVLVSFSAMLLLAQFSLRKARFILRCQRVQPPKPDGPPLRFRVKPW